MHDKSYEYRGSFLFSNIFIHIIISDLIIAHHTYNEIFHRLPPRSIYILATYKYSNFGVY